MINPSSHDDDDEGRARSLMRIHGSVPWLGASKRKHFRAKVFKSGNSLALRLPAGLGLHAGMEMNLEVEDDTFFSFEPVKRSKRKFDIDSLWGIEPALSPIRPDDRVFEERRSFKTPGSDA